MYENSEKTIEVFILHDFEGKDFYGEELTVEVVSFIRAEALFSTFNDLILAIHCDIESAHAYLEKKLEESRDL